MSVRSALTPSYAAYQARSSSLLPFLYHTRTLTSSSGLSRRSTPAHIHCKNHQTKSSSASDQARSQNSLRTRRKLFDDDVFSKPVSTPSSNTALPFEDIDSRLDGRKPPKQSTLTASEKAVFDRIFKDLEQGSLGVKEEKYDKEIGEAQETDINPFEDLNSIFEEATQRLKQEDETREQSSERPSKSRMISKPSDRQAIETLIGGKDASQSKSMKGPTKLDSGVSLDFDISVQENQEELKQACEDHETLVSMMLDRTRSDVEIWEILEKEVFDLVKQLDAHIKTEEKARKVLKKEEKKLTKEKNRGKEEIASKDTDANDQATPKISSPTTSKSIALPKTTLFSVLQTNYANCLLSALRLLRRYHPTSLYAHSILSTMKRLGPISYALGANTNIYNEILFLKWMQFSDLHGMADLMQEMVDQGIEMNEVTNIFIRRLWNKKRYGRMGRMGPVAQAWWGMRGNVEGWRRVWGIYEDVKREDKEKRERGALAAENEYEDGEGVEDGG